MLAPAACGGERPPIATTPPAVAETSAPCAAARAQRDRVAALLSEGKLDRARRVIRAADAACPSEAASSRAAELAILAELDADAPPFSSADAAALERSRAESQAAADAEARNDLDAALAAHLRAWDSGRDGRSLLRAGQVALRRNQRADAQRLFDRGIAAIERAEHEQAAVDLDGDLLLHQIAWSSRGRIAVASDRALLVLDSQTLREVARVRLENQARALAFSPDGRALASGEELGSVHLWDVETGREIRTLAKHTHDIAALAFSADGSALLSAAVDEPALRGWDVATGAELGTFASTEEDCLGYAARSRDGALAWGCVDGPVHVATASGGARPDLPEQKGRVLAAAFSPDGRTLALGGVEEVQLTSVEDGSVLHTLSGLGSHVLKLAFSPDGSKLAIVMKDELRVVGASDGKALWSEDQVEWPFAAFSPDGKSLATVDFRSLRVRSAADGKDLRSLSTQIAEITSAAFAPDNRTIASVADDRTLRLWDLASASSRDAVRSVRPGPRGEEVRAVAFAPDGSVVAAGAGSQICLWDPKGLAERRCLTESPGGVYGIAFSPDGRTLLVDRGFGDSALWDLSNDHRIGSFDGTRGVFLPSGASVGAIARGSVVLVDPTTARPTAGWVAHPSDVRALAISPDGALLATGADDHTIRLWSLPGGAALREIPTGARVERLAFVDGATILATLQGWDVGNLGLFSTDGRLLRALSGVQADASSLMDLDVAPSGGLIVTTTRDSLALHRAADFAFVGSLRQLSGVDGGYFVTPGGLVEVLGPEPEAVRSFLRCRIGDVLVDFAFCGERLEVPGLLARVIAGDDQVGAP